MTLVRVTRGVWRDADQVADLAGRVSAMLAGCPEHTVVSGYTAAVLHGLWVPTQAAEGIETIVRRDVPRGAHRSRVTKPEVRGRRQVLLPDEITDLGGIPATTEARTWLDLAGRISSADLVAVGDSALRGHATLDELTELVRRAVHRRGVVTARRVLPYLDSRSRSRPESHLRYALVAAGLPRPAVNVPIHDVRGEWLAEPDLSYDDVRLAIEYNGSEHAAVHRMRGDITRSIDVEDRGDWRVVTFGPAEVLRRPDTAVRRVRALRAERAFRLAG